MKEIFEFLRKLSRKWVVLITGSGVVALLVVWEHYTSKSIDFPVFAVLAGFLFVWASFLVWREDHTRGRVNGPPAELPAPVSPIPPDPPLKATIDQVLVAKDAEGSGDAQVILMATLANRGQPSTLDRWTLVAQSPGGRTRQAKLREITKGFVILQDGQRRGFDDGDALDEKAFRAPIPTGGMVRGVLWFHFPGVRPEEINKQGSYLVLHAWDTFGKQITVPVTFGPSHESMPVVLAAKNRPT